jgi:nitrogen fixation protein NifU and related proteins
MILSPTETIELYRDVIADHAKHPRNFREMSHVSHRAEGHNRSCGDQITVWVKMADRVLIDVSFKGSGCSIGTASASMMCEAMMGKAIDEARVMFEDFHGMLIGGDVEPDAARLGKLVVFAGVRRFPIRVKCATLPWHTLMAAMEIQNGAVTTEQRESRAR